MRKNIAIIVLSLISFASMVYAIYENTVAGALRHVAEQAAQEAMRQERLAVASAHEAIEQRKLAEASTREAIAQKTLADQLRKDCLAKK